MTTLQKIIKYLALALACFIIINIVGGILFGIYGITFFMSAKDMTTKQEVKYTEEMELNIEESNTINSLTLDLAYTNIRIEQGESFKVYSNSNDISYKQTGNEFLLKEKRHNWFEDYNASEVVLTIPEDTVFKKVKIRNGAGEVSIENLETRELDFEMGAGTVEIENLLVTDNAKINGGAGKVTIESSKINNLDLDMGIGKFTLIGKLTGRNDIDAGVGKLDISLSDGTENYTIAVSKGIGSITIDKKEAKDGQEYGQGESYIEIDGGVGAIDIR